MSYISGSVLRGDTSSTPSNNPSGTYDVPANATTVLAFLHVNDASSEYADTEATLGGVAGNKIGQLTAPLNKNRIIFKWDSPTTGAARAFSFTWPNAKNAEWYFVAFESDPTDSTYGNNTTDGFSSGDGTGGAAEIAPSVTPTVGDTLFGIGLGFSAVTVNPAGDDTLIASAANPDLDEYASALIYQDVTDTADILQFKVNDFNNAHTWMTVIRAPSAGGGVSNTIDLSNTVRNYVNNSISLASSINGYVNQSYSGSSSVNGYASNTLSASNTVFNYASNTYNGAFSVDGTGSVTAVIGLSNTVRGFVNNTSNLSNSVRAYANNTASFGNTVRGQVNQLFAGSSSIRNYASNTYNGAFSVDGFIYVTSVLGSANSVRGYVSNNLSLGFSIGDFSNFGTKIIYTLPKEYTIAKVT